MKKLINLYKPAGITPLQAIKYFKAKKPEYKNKKIAYAGRLDPLAKGVLLLLVAPETKNRSKYQNLDKTYEFTMLFGLNTDTYDVLGKIQKSKIKIQKNLSVLSKSKIKKTINKFAGEQIQKYPPYSSKTVKGKPLYWWARYERLSEIEIPTKLINIYDIQLINLNKITSSKLKSKIYESIGKVEGDFRQKEILEGWNKFFKSSKIEKFQKATISVSCSSGTYVRSLTHNIGIKLGTGALALEIVRTSAGDYKINNSLKLNLP